MDLRAYYRKLREIEAKLEEDYVVIVSLETPDGGRAGVCNEVQRAVAARMMVEGKARLATREEARAYRELLAEAKRRAEEAAAASRVQVTVIPEAELKALRSVIQQSRG